MQAWRLMSLVAIVASALLPLLLSLLLQGWASKYYLNPYSLLFGGDETRRRFGTKYIPDLGSKVALVTAGCGGIGFHTAVELARHGATVYATCRSKEKIAKASKRMKEEELIGGGSVEWLELDQSDLKNVKQFVKKFRQTKLSSGGLHVLLLNAATIVSPFNTTAQGFEMTIAVSHLSHFVLTRGLLPFVELAKGRIVVVSSEMHRFASSLDLTFARKEQPIKLYCQSKLANILFANALAKRCSQLGNGVTVNTLTPGIVSTELARSFTSSIFETSIPLPDAGLQLIFAPFSVLLQLASFSPREAALTPLYVATSPLLNDITGKYFLPSAFESRPSRLALNETMGEELWMASERKIRSYI